MAAKGSVIKETIKNKILEVFPGSFLYDNGKEIRIPMKENGELLQVKCVLTCSKTNVTPGGDTVEPGEVPTGPVPAEVPFEGAKQVPNNFMNSPTPEEKEAVAHLLETLGLA